MNKMFENEETIDERLDRIVDEYCEGEYLRGYDLEWLVYNVNQLKIIKEQNKRYREAIEDIKNAWKVTDTHQEYMDVVHDIIKDLESEE